METLNINNHYNPQTITKKIDTYEEFQNIMEMNLKVQSTMNHQKTNIEQLNITK